MYVYVCVWEYVFIFDFSSVLNKIIIFSFSFPCHFILFFYFCLFLPFLDLFFLWFLFNKQIQIEGCPWMQETHVDWIFQGPVCVVLIINLIFLLRIMWVSVSLMKNNWKLKNEKQKNKKWKNKHFQAKTKKKKKALRATTMD